MVKRAGDLLDALHQRRTGERPLSCFAPQPRGFLDQTRLGAMTRQQLRLALGNVSELAFEGLGNAGVKRTPRLAQQRAIGRVLHQRMLEQIGRVRRRALAEQQTGRNKTVERSFEFRLRLAHYRGQQGMRELPADHGADLRYLLRRAEPVKPRHQRGVQACRHLKGRERNCRGGALGSALALRFKHRFGHLLHEKRNAVGSLDDVLPDVRRQALVARQRGR